MPLPRKQEGYPPPAPRRPLTQSTEAERAEALAKLKSLFDSGVLTEEQYESERRRLTRTV